MMAEFGEEFEAFSEEVDLWSALKEPLRRQILRRMRDVEAISPSELARQIDRPVTNVAYHVRVLADCGAVTLARTEPTRGTVKHFYRSSVGPPWARQLIDLEPPPKGGAAEASGPA